MARWEAGHVRGGRPTGGKLFGVCALALMLALGLSGCDGPGLEPPGNNSNGPKSAADAGPEPAHGSTGGTSDSRGGSAGTGSGVVMVAKDAGRPPTQTGSGGIGAPSAGTGGTAGSIDAGLEDAGADNDAGF
jgi:hypothetical protein